MLISDRMAGKSYPFLLPKLFFLPTKPMLSLAKTYAFADQKHRFCFSGAYAPKLRKLLTVWVAAVYLFL